MAGPRGFVALGVIAIAIACDGDDRARIGIATNQDFASAAALAVADAQAEWGEVAADTVVAVESYTRAAVAIENATALVDLEVDAIVGHSSSAASLASAPLYNENEIVQLSPQSSASAYSDAGPYSFRLVPPDDRQGTFIAEQLRRMPELRRIVVLYVNDDYGRGLRTSLLAALGPNPPAVVGEAPHLEMRQIRPEDLNLAASIVDETRPDAIVWLGRPLILAQYLPLLRANGSVPVICSDAVSVVRHYTTSPLWENVWYVDFVDLTAPALRDFGLRYEQIYEREISSADALTYDATRLLLAAARDGARNGPEIRAWLESLGRSRPAYEGITGPIRFDEDGDVDRSYVLQRVLPPAAGTPTR